jgi:hypothetical protein
MREAERYTSPSRFEAEKRVLFGRRAATIVAVVAIAAAPLLPSCGQSFEAPCKVGDRKPIDDTTLSGRLGPIAIAEGTNGDVVFTWLRRDERSADGGADASDAGAGGDAADGGDAGDAGTSGVPTFVAPAASVLVVARDGAQKSRHTFAPPAALPVRRGGTQDVGVVFVGDAVLFHWIETTVTTLADGTTMMSASLKLQRVAIDGTEGPLVADADLACVQCTMDAVFASAFATAASIVRERPSASSLSSFSKAPTPRLVTFASDGRRLASIALQSPQPAPAIDASLDASSAASPGLGGQGAAQQQLQGSALLDSRDGVFIARLDRTAFVVDPSLARRAGPYALPTSTTAVDVDLSSGDVALSWIGNASGTIGGASQTAVGGSPDLFFQSRAASGAPLTSPHRISSSFGQLDVRRNEGRTGVIHSSGDGEWFVLVDGDGKKIGGDHPLSAGQGASIDETRRLLGFAAATSADVVSLDAHARTRLLATDGPGRWIVWSTTSEVVREAVVCAP